MKKSISCFIFIFILITGLATTGSAASQEKPPIASAEKGGSLPAGTKINAVFTKPVEAKKAKQGDQLTAKVTQALAPDGSVAAPRGSKLIGHVTEASSSGGYKIGFAFDKIVIGGQETPLQATIQAISPPGDPSSGFTSNQGMVGSAQNMDTPGGPGRYGTGVATSNNVGNTFAIDPRASGALNMKGVTLIPTEVGGVLSSDNRNIKFERDSLVLLSVQPSK
jgi:hypothetical protein